MYGYLSLQAPPSSLSLAGQTLSSLSRETTSPCLPSFLAFPPIFPLHSPSTRGTTNRNGVSSSTVTATLLLDTNPSKLQYSLATWCWGTIYVSTEQHGVKNDRGSASGRGPTGGDQRLWRLKKNDRDKHVQHQQQLTHAQFPGGRFPAKFGCQPIKLELYPLVHAYPVNYVRVHFRHLGVYIKRVE